MSVRFLHKHISRRIILFVGTLLLSVLFVIAAMQFVLLKINQNREEMVAKLRQEIDLPLAFDTIEARWSGFSLGVFVKQVVIFDPKLPIAFATIGNIALFPDISSLLFKNTLQLKRMVLQDLDLVFGWDDKNDLSILGLKGELLPTSIEYSALMALLSKLQTIVVDGAKIEWRGERVQIKQLLRGEFNWVQTPKADWEFVGTQQLQIRDGSNLPESHFNLSVSPNLERIALKIRGSGLSGQCDLQLSEDKKWQVDCSSEANAFNLAEIRTYYHPVKTDLPLLQWLFEALPKGKITEARLGIKGPFDALKGYGEVRFKDIDFQYTPGWPKIEKARGSVKIESERVIVKLSKGSMMGSPIQSLTAQILPIGSIEKPVVFVEGALESTLEKGLLFLQKSPLRASIGKHLETLNPRGFMHLNLKCEIPLNSQPLKVNGTVFVKSGQLDIPDWRLGLNQLKGAFKFSRTDLDASNVTAQLGSLPVTLNVRTTAIAKQKILELKANGVVNSAFLQQQLTLPVLKKLQGQSLFTVLLNMPLDSAINPESPILTNWSLSSDLEGMKISLPSILGKTQSEKVFMTLKIAAETKGERKIALQLLNRLDAKVVTTSLKNEVSIKNGHIVLGKGNAEWTSKKSLLVGGEMSKFKVDEWREFFDEINNGSKKKFPPLEIHLLIDQLEVYGLRFNKTWVSVDFAEKPLKCRLEGPFIKGSFSASQENEKEKFRKILVNLAYLKIMSDNISLETKITAQPAYFSKAFIHFYCQDLQYEKSNFGEVSFKLVPAAYGYQIQNLLLEAPLSELSGNGEWHLTDAGVYTTLEGKLKSLNMGETLSRWHYPTAIRESSGTIQYKFRWPKNPFQFKLGIVDGNAELKFDKGRILGVNPGLGRVMGLLNLENIYRRLQLDFSDLFKKGFVFDTLKGRFQFQNGVAKTEKLSIDGPSAKITLGGKANMNTKAIDLDMTVAPHIGMGIPLATAIAIGNPAIGAGVWIIDKLTGSKINKITRHHYHVTGTWESPSIAEATSKPARSEKEGQ